MPKSTLRGLAGGEMNEKWWKSPPSNAKMLLFCAKCFRQTIKVAVKMAKKLGFHRQNRFPVKKSLTNNRQNLRYVAFFVFCIKKLDNSMKRFSFALINHRPPVQSYPRHLVMSSIPVWLGLPKTKAPPFYACRRQGVKDDSSCAKIAQVKIEKNRKFFC